LALKRELAAAIAIPIVLAVLFLLPPVAFDLLVAGVTLAALWEFYRLAEKTGHPVAKMVGVFGSILILSASTVLWQLVASDVSIHDGASVVWARFVFLGLLATVALASVAPLFAGLDPSVALAGTGSTLLGILLVTLPATAMCFLRSGSVRGGGFGSRLVLFLLLLVWGCDSFAYYTGKTFGRRKLAPVVSPNKTWEGTLGGLVGATLVGAAAGSWWVLPEFGPARGALAAALASSAGQIGDLVESMWKRGAGVKDSGTFLPGHGGFYDRIDSLLFAGPVLAVFVASMA
jgi:phosphatidate cytidylyltransferase